MLDMEMQSPRKVFTIAIKPIYIQIASLLARVILFTASYAYHYCPLENTCKTKLSVNAANPYNQRNDKHVSLYM